VKGANVLGHPVRPVIKVSERPFAVAASRAWNNLPCPLRRVQSIDTKNKMQ